jgi:hypothetical protein
LKSNTIPGLEFPPGVCKFGVLVKLRVTIGEFKKSLHSYLYISSGFGVRDDPFLPSTGVKDELNPGE